MEQVNTPFTSNSAITEENTLFQTFNSFPPIGLIYVGAIETITDGKALEIIQATEKIYRDNGINWIYFVFVKNSGVIDSAYELEKNRSMAFRSAFEKSEYYLVNNNIVPIGFSKASFIERLKSFNPLTDGVVTLGKIGGTPGATFDYYRSAIRLSEGATEYSSSTMAYLTAHEVLHQYLSKIGYVLYGVNGFLTVDGGEHFNRDENNKIYPNLNMDGGLVHSNTSDIIIGEKIISEESEKHKQPLFKRIQPTQLYYIKRAMGYLNPVFMDNVLAKHINYGILPDGTFDLEWWFRLHKFIEDIFPETAGIGIDYSNAQIYRSTIYLERLKEINSGNITIYNNLKYKQNKYPQNYLLTKETKMSRREGTEFDNPKLNKIPFNYT